MRQIIHFAAVCVVLTLMPATMADSLMWNGKIDAINKLRTSIVSSGPSDQDGFFRQLILYAADPNQTVRAGAIASLGGLAAVLSQPNAMVAIDKLTAALDDAAQGVRREAALGLGKYGSKAGKATPALLRRAMEEAQSDVSLFAIQSIGDIGQQSNFVVPALLRMVHESANSPNTARWEAIPAVNALANYKERADEIVTGLATLYSSDNSDLLAAIVSTTASLDPGNRAMDGALLKLAMAPNVHWRIAAIRAAQNLKYRSPELNVQLSKMAEGDPVPAVRVLAKAAVGGASQSGSGKF